MELGIYCNIFKIDLSSYMSPIMFCSRSKYPDLRDLRNDKQIIEIKAYLFAHDEFVYGYGSNIEPLQNFGFNNDIVDLNENPNLATNIITSGYLNYLSKNGFEVNFPKGRYYAYKTNYPKIIPGTNISLINGVDFNIFYLFDDELDSISFVISIDAKSKIIDDKGNTLNFHQIKSKYPFGTLSKIRALQGDLLPLDNKINTEISKQRLIEYIIPFIKEHNNFQLPNGKEATIEDYPLKIIIGE